METYTYNTGLSENPAQKKQPKPGPKSLWQATVAKCHVISSDTHSLMTKLKFIPRPH